MSSVLVHFQLYPLPYQVGIVVLCGQLRVTMSRRSKKFSSKLAATLAEYSKTTTLHGLAYAFEDDQPILMRTLWAVLVATSLAMAALLSAQGM